MTHLPHSNQQHYQWFWIRGRIILTIRNPQIITAMVGHTFSRSIVFTNFAKMQARCFWIYYWKILESHSQPFSGNSLTHCSVSRSINSMSGYWNRTLLWENSNFWELKYNAFYHTLFVVLKIHPLLLAQDLLDTP